MTRLRDHWALPVLLLARVVVFLAVRRVGGPISFFVDPNATFDRLRDAQLWARAPVVVPGDEFGWLPLPAYLHGMLMRLAPDPFFLPVILNAALSLVVIALVYLVARELFGRPAAVVAAFGAAFSATAVIFGLEAAADCPMQAFLMAALWSWIRHVRTGEARFLWIAALCLGLGNATRFEMWAISAGFTAYCLFKGGRRAPLTLVWAFPMFWLAYGAYSRGDALAFLHDTTSIGFFGGPPTPMGLRYRDLFRAFADCDQPVILALALLGLPGCRADRAGSWYLVAFPLAAGFFLAANLVMTAAVAMHTWLFYLLAFPLAGGGAVRAWKALGRARWLLAALPVWFALASASALRLYATQDWQVQHKGLVEAFGALVALRQSGALAPSDKVLVELPPAVLGAGFERLWRMGPDPDQAIFDRRPVFRRYLLDENGNPSVLASPPADLEHWLAERHVRLVITAPPASAGAAWRKSFSKGGRDFWLRAGDRLPPVEREAR